MEIRSFKFDETQFPPVLNISISGAPHYRQEMEILQQYREALNYMAIASGMGLMYNDVLDVVLLFVDPTTPDLDSLHKAFARAVDSKALSGQALLVDDGLIQKITMSKYYPNGPTKYENRVP